MKTLSNGSCNSFSVPAKIVSFSRFISIPWKEDVALPCRKVGIPDPITIWRLRGSVIEVNAKKQVILTAVFYLILLLYEDIQSGKDV